MSEYDGEVQMKIYEFGSNEADTVLIQPVDEHDLEAIENEVTEIAALSKKTFRLIAMKINNWNMDLSPWKAPAIFGDEGFGDGAAKTLEQTLKLCRDRSKTYYIGGYSLAGLFALWAACQTDVFKGVAAASPSVWFNGFTEFIDKHKVLADRVYLSLGDKEEQTRNKIMSTVGDRIKEVHNLLLTKDVDTVLEWNKGNHFKEPDIRTAKAFAWVIR